VLKCCLSQTLLVLLLWVVESSTLITLHYMSFGWRFYPKRLTVLLHSYTVDAATGSNSGLSVLLKDTSTRAGIEPPTPWLKDGPATHSPIVTDPTWRIHVSVVIVVLLCVCVGEFLWSHNTHSDTCSLWQAITGLRSFGLHFNTNSCPDRLRPPRSPPRICQATPSNLFGENLRHLCILGQFYDSTSNKRKL